MLAHKDTRQTRTCCNIKIMIVVLKKEEEMMEERRWKEEEVYVKEHEEEGRKEEGQDTEYDEGRNVDIRKK